MKRSSHFTVGFLLCIMMLAQSEGVRVHNGFGTGRTYLEMPKAERAAYAMGFANGILLSPIFGAPDGKLKWLESCVEGMDNEQLAEVLLQYMKEHPAEWHHGLHLNSYRAVANACPGSPVKRKPE